MNLSFLASNSLYPLYEKVLAQSRQWSVLFSIQSRKILGFRGMKVCYNYDTIWMYFQEEGKWEGSVDVNKILIVEDEEAIANLIRINLNKAGYLCDVAYDGLAGADKLAEGRYDLCLFDIMLPGADGYELLEYAKSLDIPVIFLTAKGETYDKVRGLKAGADDYVTKPFELAELLARVENVLRRYHKAQQELKVGDMTIHIGARSVYRGTEKIELTFKEFDLLLLFVRNPNRALHREMIYEHVWGGTYMGDSRTVDLHVQRLRHKAGLEKQIQAVYKIGYCFHGED